MAGVVVLTAIVCITGTHYHPFWTNPSLEEFARLDQIFRAHGMDTYLEHKRALRESIRRALKGNPSKYEPHAENIAVFLFPDLLPNDDLEKQEATEGWADLEEKIEAAPNTPEARANLDEMKSNIWNYENADRVAPHLSEEAAQVIRIYQAISSPREGT